MNSGDAVVVCGSSGEIANDEPTNTFHLAGTVNYKFEEDYAIQKKNVWSMIALTSQDQLRQKMAWALSQILVITPNQIDESGHSEMYLNYYGKNVYGIIQIKSWLLHHIFSHYHN